MIEPDLARSVSGDFEGIRFDKKDFKSTKKYYFKKIESKVTRTYIKEPF